jgi:hypothetical protein
MIRKVIFVNDLGYYGLLLSDYALIHPSLMGPGLFFSFVIFFTQTVGFLGRGISPQ